MSRQTVIVSGGWLDESFTLEVLKSEETEYIVAADHGLQFLYQHGIMPDYIVGDFDSTPDDIVNYYRNETKVPIRQFNPVKDASDTEIALRLCLNMGRKQIVILGGTGTRIDHIWANVQSLKIAQDAGAKAYLLDAHNRIQLIDQTTVIRKEEAFGPYFSLFPLGGEVMDFNITGAKYPLQHYILHPFDSRCVSNEWADEEVEIAFPEGNVILMETRD